MHLSFTPDPLLQNSHFLAPGVAEQYREAGHTIIRQLASQEEIARYREAIREVVYAASGEQKPLNERDTYGKAFIQIGNLWERDETVRRFVLARRFAKVAAELMGVSGVRIYHDQALFKEAGGGHTPWHQDQVYWPLDTDKTITMWMPLVPISEQMGSMTFASGSHRNGFITKVFISDESHRTLAQYVEGKGFEQISYGAMEAGDATFHAGWTLHSAPGNPTDRTRETMTVIYMADDTVIAEPDNNARKADLARWMPGRSGGQLADTVLNPLVYQQGE